MGVVIETQTDAFALNLIEPQNTTRPNSMVRRPFRGIEIKNDTYATLRVITSDGSKIPLVDAGGPLPPIGSEGPVGNSDPFQPGKIPSRAGRRMMASTPIYSNFIVQSIKDSRQEKAQFMETFGDTYIFFFGERPRILTVQGLLFNTLDFNWRTEFWYNYENHLRGTKLVEQDARVYLAFDDIVVEGYMLGADAEDNAEMPYHIPFSFQLFVTNHVYLSPYGDPFYPTRNYVISGDPNETSLTVQSTAGKTKDVLVQGQLVEASIKNATYALAGAGLVGNAAIFNSLLGRAGGTNTTPTLASKMAVDLIKAGIMAQSVTFLNVLARYFKMPVNPANPVRTLPARSMIRDNKDEYVNGSYSSVNYDRAAQAEAQARMQALKTAYMVETAIVAQLQAMEVSSVQLNDPDDGASPMSQAHRFQFGATPTGVSPQSVIQGLRGR
jgi:hypothetical protein